MNSHTTSRVSTPTQGDGKGDACDDDKVDDGVANPSDNCPKTHNPNQNDADGDGTGDVCDDSDFDSVPDSKDNCPTVWNPARIDTDGDSKPDEQADTDSDGIGDACDSDIDGDGVSNSNDICPGWNEPSDVSDEDGDGRGDHRDTDGDGVADTPIAPSRRDDCDNCPNVANSSQANANPEDEFVAVGDACSPDDDGDNIKDENDNCPKTDNFQQRDRDGDGTGDACEGLAGDFRRGRVTPEEVPAMVSTSGDFARRATSVNAIPLPECLPSVCESSSDTVPDDHFRVTEVVGPNDFRALLVDGTGNIVRRVDAGYDSEGGHYEATVWWRLEKGAHWPESTAVDDVVITQSHTLRIVPTAEEGTEIHYDTYVLDHSIVDDF